MPLWPLLWPARSGKPLLGIDIGPSQACLLACSRFPRPGHVEQCAVTSLPAEGLQDGRIVHFELMADTLRQLVASAGGGRRIAMALPEAAWQQVLELPAGLAPWAWRRWLTAQAEQLSLGSADELVWCVEPVIGSRSKLRLTVRVLEDVQDWQGLAEAAGLELVLLDDRQRVIHLALRALGLEPVVGRSWVLAEAEDERCTLHQWSPERAHVQRSWVGELPAFGAQDSQGDANTSDIFFTTGLQADQDRQDFVSWPAGGWITGAPEACQLWAPRLATALGGAWPVLDPSASLSWRTGLLPPSEMSSPLVALGLTLRAWCP